MEGDVVFTFLILLLPQFHTLLTPYSFFYILKITNQFTTTSFLLLTYYYEFFHYYPLSTYLYLLPLYTDYFTVTNLIHHTSILPYYFYLLTYHYFEPHYPTTHSQSLETLVTTA